MIPPPRPTIIEKDRFRFVFNEPAEQGCVSIEIDGHGVSMMLDDNDLEKLARAFGRASARIRANRA